MIYFDFSGVVLKHVLDDKDLATVKQSSYVESTSFLCAIYQSDIIKN